MRLTCAGGILCPKADKSSGSLSPVILAVSPTCLRMEPTFDLAPQPACDLIVPRRAARHDMSPAPVPVT